MAKGIKSTCIPAGEFARATPDKEFETATQDTNRGVANPQGGEEKKGVEGGGVVVRSSGSEGGRRGECGGEVSDDGREERRRSMGVDTSIADRDNSTDFRDSGNTAEYALFNAPSSTTHLSAQVRQYQTWYLGFTLRVMRSMLPGAILLPACLTALRMLRSPNTTHGGACNYQALS